MRKEVKIAIGIIALGVVGFVIYRAINPRKSNKPEHTGITSEEMRKIENICETKYNTDEQVSDCVQKELLKRATSTPKGFKPMKT